MLCSYIMKSNTSYSGSDIQGLGSVSMEEWTTFLQGKVLASMLKDHDLQDQDGNA